VVALLQPKLAKDGRWAGAMGLLVLVGFGVARANIVFPALSVPELEGLSTAFQGPHLNFDYLPSLMEWSVVLGVVGLSTLAYLFGADRLSLWSARPAITPKTEVKQ
jgi:molybdopterin-containing oxidoreductase family membrane subunit